MSKLISLITSGKATTNLIFERIDDFRGQDNKGLSALMHCVLLKLDFLSELKSENGLIDNAGKNAYVHAIETNNIQAI